jgi:hypothetical protein
MKTINKQIICKPFAKPHNEPIAKGRVQTIKTGSVLEGLEVLIDAHIVDGDYEAEVKAGQLVYVRADRYASAWGRDRCTSLDFLFTTEQVDGKEVKKSVEFIVVPFSEVIAVGDKKVD